MEEEEVAPAEGTAMAMAMEMTADQMMVGTSGNKTRRRH